MKKIITFGLFCISILMLYGCQSITLEYDFHVNMDNPLKSIYFVDQKPDSRMLAHFNIKNQDALYFFSYGKTLENSPKITYNQVLDSESMTFDTFKMANMHYAGRFVIDAIYDHEVSCFVFRSAMSKTYSNNETTCQTHVIESPLNRLSTSDAYHELKTLYPDSFTAFNDVTILDSKAQYEQSKFISLHLLILIEDNLHLVLIQLEEDIPIITNTPLHSNIKDALFLNAVTDIIMIDHNNQLLKHNSLDVISLGETPMNFYGTYVWYEYASLDIITLELENEIRFYSSDLALLNTFTKSNFTYVGLNIYPLEFEAYMMIYYLDDTNLERTYSKIAHLV